MLQELVSSFRLQITESEKTETNKPFANSCQAGVALEMLTRNALTLKPKVSNVKFNRSVDVRSETVHLKKEGNCDT